MPFKMLFCHFIAQSFFQDYNFRMNILKSQRLHIGIFGRRNVGKSSLLNFITQQNVSIVSDIAGTTTDVVEKVMELIPIGPVVLFDTAGIDDEGNLGQKRIEKTFSSVNRIDVAFIVCDYEGISEYENEIIAELKKRNTPFGIIINKNDIGKISDEKLFEIKKISDNVLEMNILDEKYRPKIKELLINIMPQGFFDDEKILSDVVSCGDYVVQVIPIDDEAPKGRLILPQVKTIRDALDNKTVSVVCQVSELQQALSNLKNPPKLVITDSQAFKEVAQIVPENIYLTSYSILFARLKGDLNAFVDGAKRIDDLNDGDKILICESCTHPSSCEDIGRVKIPKLLEKKTGKKLVFDVFGGHDFPNNLSEYSLIIHCGGCMTNKKEILSRIILANDANIPITNYGIAISKCLNILERAIKVFQLN